MKDQNNEEQKNERTTLDRRGFLKGALAAGAGALGSVVVPYSALGMGGRTAPSDKIGMGFVGLGKIGRGSHLRSFLHRDDVQVVALCDVESIRLGMAKRDVEHFYAGKYGKGSYRGCAIYHDFRELLARDDIDAIVISTPDHWHGLISIEAARSGKDVYCEKPMTHSTVEGRAVVNAVRKYGRVFQTGSQQRSEFGGRFRRAAELVQSGRIGKLERVHVQVGGPGIYCDLPPQPVPEGLDWDFWVGPSPWRPYHEELAPPHTYGGWPNWRGYEDFGGGGLSDFGAHHFDIAQWAMGTDDTGPTRLIPPDGDTVERLTLIYASGIPVYHGGGRGDVDFIGTEGRIMVSRGSIHSEPASILNEYLGPEDVELNRHTGHRSDWLNCVRTRDKPIADVEIGHRTATICHIGSIALKLKRPLDWDPVQERFAGDPEANRLLRQPMRSPWRI